MKKMKRTMWGGVGVLALITALGMVPALRGRAVMAQQKGGVPTYQVDPFWPKYETNWIFGSIGGIAIDPTNDHVFVLNRPKGLQKDENAAASTPPTPCCVAAPSVMEFDPSGKLIRGWGGQPGPGYVWPEIEHGITIDYKGNVWIAGNGKTDTQVLKFTKDGKFLLQIGHGHGKSEGSNDIENFNQPTKAVVYPKTNEVFISDGYGNRRVIVFDADTGQYKRHWGAYGNKPDDKASMARVAEGPGPQQFNLPHAVTFSNEDLLYVNDRTNNRIQIFKPDGTFVKEGFIRRDGPSGTVCDLAFSPDKQQRFIYTTDIGNQQVLIIDRQTLQPVGQFGREGHSAGQFHHIHALAIDSKGNLYTGEGPGGGQTPGKRVQKWILKSQ